MNLITIRKGNDRSKGASEESGSANGLANRREKAHAILEQTEDRNRPGDAPSAALPMIHVGLGDDESVFLWLRKALEEPDASAPWLGQVPCFDRPPSTVHFLELPGWIHQRSRPGRESFEDPGRTAGTG
jgi:hypothetical protein